MMELIALFVLGLLIGSFLNVLADRLPKEEDVLWGRSRCDFCRKTLRWYELIPVASFLLQGGRCLRCKKKLSIQYSLVECFTAVGFVLCAMAFPHSWLLLTAALIIFSSFVVIFVADLKYQIIPDSMVVTTLIGTILWIWQSHALSEIGIRLLVGLVSFGFFYAIWFFTQGRGMGFGDVKLAGVLGLLLGFPSILFALYCAFLTGAGAGVILMIARRKTLKSKIAFGPFLLLGVAIAIIFHTSLAGIWKSIF
jgi:prepilin signal peptidase PulO-like enzyme (type II secretory pathway)